MKQKKYFFVWSLVLWIIPIWALVEWTFPRNSYTSFWLPTIILLLLLGSVPFLIGKRLYIYIGKIVLSKKRLRVFTAAFIAATLVLIVVLGPRVITSLSNKDRVQRYLDDLRSQGFDAEYYAQYPYNRGAVSHVYSYEDFTSLAKDLNCTWVGVYGGAPYFFLFFFPSSTFFLINQNGQYLFWITW